MKFVIVLALAVACALAAPVDDKNAQIVSQNTDINPDGSYQSEYKTSNEISAVEQGVLAEGRDEKNNPLQYLVRSGKYSWPDAQGVIHTITWTAGLDGYKAEGDDVPKTQP